MNGLKYFIGGVLFLMTTVLLVHFVATVVKASQMGTAAEVVNINALLERNKNWYKITGLPNLGITAEEYIDIIDGSTVTIPMTAEVLRQFFGYTDDEIRLLFYNPYGGLHASSTTHGPHHTTHAAYESLIMKSTNVWGKADIIFVTGPSDGELALASSKGVTLEMKSIAKDGFVFINHKDNPVNNLSVEQIRDIYSGDIKNWNGVGGTNAKIMAYQREENSGSQTAMINLVMDGKKMISAPEVYYIESSMSGLIKAIAEYQNSQNSIGYTYNYYVDYLYTNNNVKTISVNGVAPTDENFINEIYPFTTSYYAVIRGNEPIDSTVRKIYDFFASSKGQELIKLVGYTGAGL